MAKPKGNFKDTFTKKAKQEWLKALRSGEYKQTTGMLMTANQHGKYFCCLGVYQDVRGFESTDKEILSSNEHPYTRNGSDVLGLSSVIQKRLASMNDNGKSFEEIADYIETNIKPVKK